MPVIKLIIAIFMMSKLGIMHLYTLLSKTINNVLISMEWASLKKCNSPKFYQVLSKVLKFLSSKSIWKQGSAINKYMRIIFYLKQDRDLKPMQIWKIWVFGKIVLIYQRRMKRMKILLIKINFGSNRSKTILIFFHSYKTCKDKTKN